MNRAIRFLLIVVLWAGAAAPGVAAAAGGETFDRGEVVVVTAAGRHRFQVEIADTVRERAQGLQGRRTLAADAGMMFDFGESQRVTMWMKDTFVALDMIFIDGRGRIINIARDTVPLSLAVVESAAPARGVLEVRAGTSARLGIRAGDRVEHPIFE